MLCRKVLSAPNLLRIGTAENIFVECQDCTGGEIRVDINVMNHPTQTKRLASTSVTLKSTNNFQEIGEITVDEKYYYNYLASFPIMHSNKRSTMQKSTSYMPILLLTYCLCLSVLASDPFRRLQQGS